MMFWDISKGAFNKVGTGDCKIRKILQKGKLLKWQRNYLTRRQRKTLVIDGESSNYRNLTAGVPTTRIHFGTITILVHKRLPNDNNQYLNIGIYRDDSTLYLYVHYQDAHQAKDKLQEDLSNIEHWAEKWLVCFNPSKTV